MSNLTGLCHASLAGKKKYFAYYRVLLLCTMLINYLQRFGNWLLVTECLLCRNQVNTGKNLCVDCISQLPWNHVACERCAAPFDQMNSFKEEKTIICGQCLSSPPLVTKAYAAFVYQTPIAQLITQFKFRQQLTCGSILSELLLKFLQRQYQSQHWPQAIIPVPLHRKRLAERGYNQANELARPLAKSLNIPLCLDLCARVKETNTQTTVSARERAINLKNAFTTVKSHTLNHVAIVDDVLTTGSTVAALAHTLTISGVEQIDVWAVAKTMQPDAMIPILHQ